MCLCFSVCFCLYDVHFLFQPHLDSVFVFIYIQRCCIQTEYTTMLLMLCSVCSLSGHLLSPQEQATYDSNSGNTAEKITHLQGEIKGMVDNGQLTAAEKEVCVVVCVGDVC